MLYSYSLCLDHLGENSFWIKSHSPACQVTCSKKSSPKKQNLVHDKSTCHLPTSKQTHLVTRKTMFINHDRLAEWVPFSPDGNCTTMEWPPINVKLPYFFMRPFGPPGTILAEPGQRTLSCVCSGCSYSTQCTGCRDTVYLPIYKRENQGPVTCPR